MSTVAVVIGASSGFGLATAGALLRTGWRVIGVSRDPRRSERAGQRRRPVAEVAGGSVDLRRADLSRQADIRALVDGLPVERIDVLVFGRRRETPTDTSAP